MVPPKSDKSILLWTRSPRFDEEPLIFGLHFLLNRIYRIKAWCSSIFERANWDFFSHLTFLPMAAWGHFSNGAWGQLPRVQGKGLERHYTSAVFPNRHLHLFLLQNRHQQGFARLFVTTWNCSPPGTPDIITNGSRGSAVKNKIPIFFCVKPWYCCPMSLTLCVE